MTRPALAPMGAPVGAGSTPQQPAKESTGGRMSLLREGFTTGTCAAAAAKAATALLVGVPFASQVEVSLPDGTRVRLPVARGEVWEAAAEAAVCKDAGDDPDITHTAYVVATVRWGEGPEVVLRAGEGVGTVTKPGLSVAPGEPAINPVPRAMILAAVREVTTRGVEVTIGIPGGRALAAKTFNPRLGIEGGLSILGTTGRVRPFSLPALREALACAVRVTKAASIVSPVLVPGHIGWRAAHRHFRLAPEQTIEIGNEWGFVLDKLADPFFVRYLVVGHAGKLTKLSEGHWDTHSSRSPSALPAVVRIATELLGRAPPERSSVEGLLTALDPGERAAVANTLAIRVANAIGHRVRRPVTVALIDMTEELLAYAGELEPWQ